MQYALLLYFLMHVRRLLAKTLWSGKVVLVSLLSLSSIAKAQSFKTKERGGL